MVQDPKKVFRKLFLLFHDFENQVYYNYNRVEVN
jgi:hypothetical protein